MSNLNNNDRQGQNLDRYLDDTPATTDSEADFLPKNDWGRFMPALLFLLITLALTWRVVDTFHWPTVTGKVERTWVGSSGRGGTHFYIRYSYSIGDKTYSHSSPWAQVFAESASYSEQFPPGTQLLVRYNRQNPADAVLHPGESVLEILWIPGVLFLGALIPALCRKTYYQTPPADDFSRGLQTVLSGQGELPNRKSIDDTSSESVRLQQSEQQSSDLEGVCSETKQPQCLHSPLLDDNEQK